jgi:dienelactone hydrolase
VDPVLLTAMREQAYLDVDLGVLDTWATLASPARRDAAWLEHDGGHPLLLFAPGFGVASGNYSTLLAGLASRGFVVAALEAPYAGFARGADGRVRTAASDMRGPMAAPERVEEVAGDGAFVLGVLLDRAGPAAAIARRVDRSRVGFFGHSLGGAAALHATLVEPRFAAVADLDGSTFGRVDREGVARPYLVLLNEPGEARRPPAELREARRAEWANVVGRSRVAGQIATVAETTHFSFSDLPFLVPPEVFAKSGATIAPDRLLEIELALLAEFFSRAFAAAPALPLTDIARRLPEIRLEAFQPGDGTHSDR